MEAELPPDRVLTVPNLLSAVRLALIPVFIYVLLVAHAQGWAVAILMFSGASDWADGKIARSLNQSSRLGVLLDPAVDRLYMVAVPVTMAVRGIVPWWFVGLVLGRDLWILIGVLAVMALTKVRKFPPSRWGKLSTFVQIVTAICWMTRNAWPTPALDAISSVMLWVCAGCTFASGLDYTWRGVHLTRAH